MWFGENLNKKMMRGIDRWIDDGGKVDLMLVVGTSAEVYPAAGYITQARDAGAVVAVINLDAESAEGLEALDRGDFAFSGNAAELLPRLLEPVIGKPEEEEK